MPCFLRNGVSKNSPGNPLCFHCRVTRQIRRKFLGIFWRAAVQTWSSSGRSIVQDHFHSRPGCRRKNLSKEFWRCPKDPSVLKRVRRANSLRREKNATAIAKRYGECSEVLVFLGERGRKTVRIAKNYGGSKILRNRVPYYF